MCEHVDSIQGGRQRNGQGPQAASGASIEAEVCKSLRSECINDFCPFLLCHSTVGCQAIIIDGCASNDHSDVEKQDTLAMPEVSATPIAPRRRPRCAVE